jgi:hypothetical protein
MARPNGGSAARAALRFVVLIGVVSLFSGYLAGGSGRYCLVTGAGYVVNRWGLVALMLAALLSAAFAPLAFLGSLGVAAVGVALWGVGMGIQDSIMSAPVLVLVHPDRRAYAFGVFNALYGVAWFAGSSAMGLIYSSSIVALVVFSVVAQLLAAGILFAARDRIRPAVAGAGAP